MTAPRADWLSVANLRKLIAGGSNQWWVPLLFLFLLTLAVGGYASLRTDVFLTPLNIRHILLATAPLALVTMAQFNVLMVRGFDVSVGAVISLTVVIGSFLMAEDMGAGLILLGFAGLPRRRRRRRADQRCSGSLSSASIR